VVSLGATNFEKYLRDEIRELDLVNTSGRRESLTKEAASNESGLFILQFLFD
jgi:hypothetical protein